MTASLSRYERRKSILKLWIRCFIARGKNKPIPIQSITYTDVEMFDFLSMLIGEWKAIKWFSRISGIPEDIVERL